MTRKTFPNNHLFFGLMVILCLHLVMVSCQQTENISETDTQNIPYVRTEWQAWIQNNHHPILSLDSDDLSDLDFLENVLKDKKIVLLGELAHGVAEQNRLRVRIIKYLHQKLGFSVVAFESPLFECYFMNRDLPQTNSLKSIRNSLHGFWHTRDLIDLFDYVKESRNGTLPINISGFDIYTVGNLRELRPDFFREIVEKVDKDFAETIYETEQMLVSLDYEGQKSYLKDNYSELSAQYTQLIKMISDQFEFLKKYYSEEYLEIAKRVAEGTLSLIFLRNDILSQTPLGEGNARDFKMYQNINWIFTKLYKNQKMVIWSHNCHIMRASTSINNQYGNTYPVMMGDLLDYTYGAKMYNTISLSFEGKIRLAEKIQSLNFSIPECIEAILYYSNKDICLIDLSQQPFSEGCSWMFQKINQTYWHRNGNYRIYYRPKQQYDAILYIKTVSPPLLL